MDEQRAVLTRVVGVETTADESPSTEIPPELMESRDELSSLDLAKVFETIRWDAVIDSLLPGEPFGVVDEEPDRKQ